MAKHTLGAAAKLVGKSKPTLSRACKNGTLTYSKNNKGEYQIETSELERVYGSLHYTSAVIGTMKQSETSNNDNILYREIELLREMLDKTEADRDQWRQQAQKITTLIEGKRNKKSFLARLLGNY